MLSLGLHSVLCVALALVVDTRYIQIPCSESVKLLTLTLVPFRHQFASLPCYTPCFGYCAFIFFGYAEIFQGVGRPKVVLENVGVKIVKSSDRDPLIELDELFFIT